MQAIASYIRECIRLLWMVFFRPNSFVVEIEQASDSRIFNIVAKSPIVAVTFSLFFGILLIPLFKRFEIPYSLTDIVSAVIAGLFVGCIIALVVDTAIFRPVVKFRRLQIKPSRRMAYGLIVGLRGAMTMSAVAALGFPLTRAGSGGILPHVLIYIALGITFGVPGNFTYGMRRALPLGMAVFLSGLILEGIRPGLIYLHWFMMAYFGMLLMPIEICTTLWATFRAVTWPPQAPRYLRYSLAYWDEVTMAPQPFLKGLLLIVGWHDRNELIKAVAHLTTKTLQHQIAFDALVDTAARDLADCTTLDDMAQIPEKLIWLTSNWQKVSEKNANSKAHGLIADSSVKPWQNRPEDLLPAPAIQILPRGVLRGLEDTGIKKAIEECIRASQHIQIAISKSSRQKKQQSLAKAILHVEALREYSLTSLKKKRRRAFLPIAERWLILLTDEIEILAESNSFNKESRRVPEDTEADPKTDRPSIRTPNLLRFFVRFIIILLAMAIFVAPLAYVIGGWSALIVSVGSGIVTSHFYHAADRYRLPGHYTDQYHNAFLIDVLLGIVFGLSLLIIPQGGKYAYVWSLTIISLVAGFSYGFKSNRLESLEPTLVVRTGFGCSWQLAIFLGIAIGIANGWKSGIAGAATILLTTTLGYIIGRYIGGLLRPGFLIFADLIEYLKAMTIPVIGFTMGYFLISFVFAGFYMALWSIDQQGSFIFHNPEESPAFSTFFYFSIVTIATLGYGDITPKSGLARSLTSLEVAVGVGWITIVFAAVMAHLQPRLAKIARIRNEAGEKTIEPGSEDD
jgi:hypothetical protein